MSIAILCPTHNRPEQCRRMMQSVLKTASSAYVWLGISGEDFPFDPDHVTRFSDGQTTAFKWNYLADLAMKNPDTKLFMLGADDMHFSTYGWDKALLDHYNALENKIHVYALQDSRDPEGTPHIIVTREYIDALGYFVPPVFVHWHVDSWTVSIARSNGCFTHMKDYLLVHDKPSDKGQADETHNRIRRWGWHERDQAVAKTMAHVLEAEKLRLGIAMNVVRSSK